MAQVHQFLTEVPRFLVFFEDSVLGSRCDGVRKASIVWRQVATDRGSESSAAKSVRGSRCGLVVRKISSVACSWLRTVSLREIRCVEEFLKAPAAIETRRATPQSLR